MLNRGGKGERARERESVGEMGIYICIVNATAQRNGAQHEACVCCVYGPVQTRREFSTAQSSRKVQRPAAFALHLRRLHAHNRRVHMYVESRTQFLDRILTDLLINVKKKKRK